MHNSTLTDAKSQLGKSDVQRLALNSVIGTHELSAWQPVPGITWVQCRTPEHANRLAKRSDSRLVVRAMAGGYLKTYEFHRPLSWAMKLIRRYTRQHHTANAAKLASTSTALTAKPIERGLR